jgi:hypothetical protein
MADTHIDTSQMVCAISTMDDCIVVVGGKDDSIGSVLAVWQTVYNEVKEASDE